MQIYTSKNILLISLLFLLPAVLSAQLGTRKYITRSGDTTIIVNNRLGLQSDDAQFLHDTKISQGYLDKYTRYNILKDAADETENVAKILDVEKNETNPSSGSLSFRIAQKNIRYLHNEQKARRNVVDNKINTDASVEELTFMKEKFGGKPSYFINGIHVDASTAASVAEKDILTRSLKVSNTATGNPNGEVWYVVNSKTFAKLGLEDYDMPIDNYVSQPNRGSNNTFANPLADEEAILNQEIVTMPSSITPSEYKQLSPAQQEKLTAQKREIEELKRQIEEVKQQRAAISGGTYMAPNSVIDYNTPANKNTETYARPNPRRVQQAEEIVGFKDSPQERARRARDEMKIEVQEDDDNSGITEDTPKRSVRRIKERERNR